MLKQITLTQDERQEGLRLERALAHAHDMQHVAQNDLNRYVAHIGALYAVPDGWKLVDWLRGFEPRGEGKSDG